MKRIANLLLNAFLLSTATTMMDVAAIQVGESIPGGVDLHFGFPPERVSVKDRVAGKKVILVPGYLANTDAMKQLGIDEVLIYCVNDGAVMSAWAESQGVPNDSMIQLMGDPYGELTEKLDMELTHAGPKEVGLINRCKRFALYIEDGVVKVVRVAEREDDPAGDDFPDVTLAESMVEAIKELSGGSEEL